MFKLGSPSAADLKINAGRDYRDLRRTGSAIEDKKKKSGPSD